MAECNLCSLTSGHDGAYMVAQCRVHRLNMLVATDHDKVIDLNDPDTREEIAADVCRIGSPPAGYVWTVPEPKGYGGLRRDSGASAGHPHIHLTSNTIYVSMPAELAQTITDLAQEACQYFHPDLYPDFHFEAVWTDREISDDEARDRIQGFQYGMDRELARYTGSAFAQPNLGEGLWNWRFDDDWRDKHREWIVAYKEYASTPDGFHDLHNRSLLRMDLEALPFSLQRALVTRWERAWAEYDNQYSEHMGFYGDFGWYSLEDVVVRFLKEYKNV